MNQIPIPIRNDTKPTGCCYCIIGIGIKYDFTLWQLTRLGHIALLRRILQSLNASCQAQAGTHGLILADDSDNSAMRVFGEPPGHGFQLSLE